MRRSTRPLCAPINTGRGAEKRGSDQAIERSQGGRSTKIHAAVDALGNPTGHQVSRPMEFTLSLSQVGSRAGGRRLGAGGDSIAFALDRSPATMVSFPTPATSNAACGFPALRFPVCFMPRVMGPIALGALSAGIDDEPDSR